MTQDATHLYWFAESPTPPGASTRYRIARRPKTGGAVEDVLPDIDPIANDMVVYDGSLYWATRRIEAVDLESGTVTEFVPSSAGADHEALAVDEDAIFALDDGNGLVVRVDRTTLASATTATFEGSAHALRIDTTHIYWSAGSSVQRVPKTGGAVLTLAREQNSPHSLALDATHVYWANYVGNGSIHRVPKSGGPIEDLGLGGGNVRAIEVDSGFVYWAGYTAGLRRIPATGGVAEQLDTGRLLDFEVVGDRVFVLLQNLSPSSTELREVRPQ